MSSTAETRTRGAGGDRRGPALHSDRVFHGRIPDSSVESSRRVTRFDGRTRILAARQPGGVWHRTRYRTRLTRGLAMELRDAGIAELVLRRGFHRASFSLAWLSTPQD